MTTSSVPPVGVLESQVGVFVSESLGFTVDGTVYKLPLAAELVAILSEFMWQSGGVSGLQFLAHSARHSP